MRARRGGRLQFARARAFAGAAVLLCLGCGLSPSIAQEDFTFRRVRVADMVPGRLELVQIDPVEQARRLAATAWSDPALARGAEAGEPLGVAPTAEPKVGPKSRYDWYWLGVSPSLGGAAGRFPSAMVALSQGPGGGRVDAPRLSSMQTLAEIYGREVLMATVGTKVSPALVLAVMGIESAGRKEAVSSAGAVGLMQLIPATAARFGVSDSTDPAQNIKGGVAYLDWLMAEFDHDPLMVLAAYNAGEGAVRKHQGVPPYAETRDYVPKVLAAWQVAQGLCQTPPELVSDPCVFAVMAEGGAAKRE